MPVSKEESLINQCWHARRSAPSAIRHSNQFKLCDQHQVPSDIQINSNCVISSKCHQTFKSIQSFSNLRHVIRQYEIYHGHSHQIIHGFSRNNWSSNLSKNSISKSPAQLPWLLQKFDPRNVRNVRNMRNVSTIRNMRNVRTAVRNMRNV